VLGTARSVGLTSSRLGDVDLSWLADDKHMRDGQGHEYVLCPLDVHAILSGLQGAHWHMEAELEEWGKTVQHKQDIAL
jgi:hypothetical protein